MLFYIASSHGAGDFEYGLELKRKLHLDSLPRLEIDGSSRSAVRARRIIDFQRISHWGTLGQVFQSASAPGCKHADVITAGSEVSYANVSILISGHTEVMVPLFAAVNDVGNLQVNQCALYWLALRIFNMADDDAFGNKSQVEWAGIRTCLRSHTAAVDSKVPPRSHPDIRCKACAGLGWLVIKKPGLRGRNRHRTGR